MSVPADNAPRAPEPAELQLDIELTRGQFSLRVQERLPLAGVNALFGPSGGGKTTLLRVIAGFERDAGTVKCGETLWSGTNARLPPQERGVGFVFQNARLFDHLSVAGNLAYADKRSSDGTALAYRIDDVVAAFELESLLDRRTQELSGGETQRVALARTLLSRPRLMLLDEPLVALDQRRKADILPYLDTLIRGFEIPTLYVSHDVDEVARFADRMLVLGEGRVHAHGPTAEVLERLDLQSLTGRFEAGTLVEGTIVDSDAAFQLVHVALGTGDDAQRLVLPWLQSSAPEIGQKIALRVRSRDLSLAQGDTPPTGLSIRNILRATLLELQPTPDTPFVEALLQVDAQRLRARVTRAAVAELGLAPGQEVFALIKSVTFETLD